MSSVRTSCICRNLNGYVMSGFFTSGGILSGYLRCLSMCLLQTMLAIAVLTSSSPALAAGANNISEEERWEQIRLQLFGERDIAEDAGVISLDAPGRAFDGARVPVTIRAVFPQSDAQYIKRLHLIVDNNPVPVAGTFEFETSEGWDTIDTELRINEYSFMRAVAELNDGKLHMASSFIKAVGGCSAPPSSYDRSDVTLLGSFSGGVDQLLNPKVPALARIRIIHPNASGMQFDQFTRTYIPAHYIHTMKAAFNDELLFTLNTNFSLSQDPVLGFNFRPKESGTLTLSAIDSEDRRFEQSWDISSF